MATAKGDAASVDALLEESAEDLYENAPCGYFSTLEGGRIVKVNETFLQWTGYSREALVGEKRIQDILAPGDRIYHETHYAPLLRMQGSVREIAVEFVRADGSRLPVLVNAVLRREEPDAPGVVRTTVFDARERRSYERELVRARQESEQRARAAEALALVAEGVVLVDADGRVQLMNPAAEALLGASREASVGQALAEAVPAWGAIGDRVPVGAPGRWPPPATLPLARGDAESWVAIAGISAGEGFVYTLRDVTADHRLDELRSDIVAIVSHELRTPLSGIVGAAQTLLAHGKSLDAALRDQLLDVIVEQSNRQERVLDEILLAGRLDAEPPSLEDDVFAASDAVAAARDVFAGAPEVGARVVVEDGEDVRVRADRGSTQQVLVNLIENALKYAPPDTPVRVAVGDHDGWARFTVADEGPGIPTHARDDVFEKFFRLDPEQQSGVGGVGLGLYITRELVARMGGRVGLLDAERGATFFVDLPRAD
jgi:PAS domain S-box-containing protein